MKVLAITCLSLGVTTLAVAQATPNSREPAKKVVKEYAAPSARKNKKWRRAKVEHTALYEFYDRVEKAAREKKRLLRILSKPQYANPRYFGHKRIPKRRPSYEMRYCNECGIRH